jgi:hypothetical protein
MTISQIDFFSQFILGRNSFYRLMDKSVRIFLSLLILADYTYAQGLDSKRVIHLKNSVVRISCKNGTDNSTGTGFFINPDGDIVTCWHVIASAITKNIFGYIVVDSIKIKMQDGETENAIIYPYFLEDGNSNAVLYDYCILKLSIMPKNKISFLNLGNFDSAYEGDEIYSSSYPFGIESQFISKGIFSSKIIDTIWYYLGKDLTYGLRIDGFMDLTMNKGSSGEPIIKLGKSLKDDMVIAIGDFIYNPIGSVAQKLINSYKTPQASLLGNNTIQEDQNILYAEGLTIMPTGISGCVSINYLTSVHLYK